MITRTTLRVVEEQSRIRHEVVAIQKNPGSTSIASLQRQAQMSKPLVQILFFIHYLLSQTLKLMSLSFCRSKPHSVEQDVAKNANAHAVTISSPARSRYTCYSLANRRTQRWLLAIQCLFWLDSATCSDVATS